MSALQSIVDGLSVALTRPVLLDDAELVPVAYSAQWGEIDDVRSESILSRGATPAVRRALFAQGIAKARAPLRIAADSALGMSERMCVPVRCETQVVGYIWLLHGDEPLADEELARTRDAAEQIARLLTQPARSATGDESVLIAALRSEDAAERARGEAELQARDLLPDPRVVVCLLAGGDDVELVVQAQRAARQLSVGHAVAGAAPEGAALIASVGDPVLRSVSAHEIAAWLHAIAGCQLSVGQSGVHGIAALRDAARQAGVALRVARSLPAGRMLAAWSALGADRLVAQLPAAALDDVPEALSRLLCDEPTLGETLASFLDAAGDVKITAANLSLHRSGLYYRLRRIEELTGLRLDRGDDRLLAHLALRAERLS